MFYAFRTFFSWYRFKVKLFKIDSGLVSMCHLKKMIWKRAYISYACCPILLSFSIKYFKLNLECCNQRILVGGISILF